MARLFFSPSNLINNCRLLINNGLPQITQASGLRQKFVDKLKELKVPPKPKRPLSPYFKFVQDHREAILKQNPHWKMTQVTIQCASDWRSIDPSIKAKYETEYKAEMEKYADKYFDYTESLTEEQKDALKEYSTEVKNSKAKREKRKKLRELDKPKRPPGAYMMYLMDQAKILDRKLPQLMKELKDKWGQLPPNEKSKYVEAANKKKLQYQEDLKKWELKMIEQGEEDLVRQSTLSPKKK